MPNINSPHTKPDRTLWVLLAVFGAVTVMTAIGLKGVAAHPSAQPPWYNLLLMPSVLGLFAVGGVHSGASALQLLIAMSVSEGLVITMVVASLMRLASWARPREIGRHAA